jgi:hypothetical protein
VAKKLPQDISSLSKDADAVTRKLKETRTKRANCPQCYVWRLLSVEAFKGCQNVPRSSFEIQ